MRRCRDGAGRGKVTYPSYSDGRVYEGEFRAGLPGGQGKMTDPDGEIYEEEFRIGKRHGRGKVTYRDGRIEEGMFNEGRIVSGHVTSPKQAKRR